MLAGLRNKAERVGPFSPRTTEQLRTQRTPGSVKYARPRWPEWKAGGLERQPARSPTILGHKVGPCDSMSQVKLDDLDSRLMLREDLSCPSWLTRFASQPTTPKEANDFWANYHLQHPENSEARSRVLPIPRRPRSAPGALPPPILCTVSV